MNIVIINALGNYAIQRCINSLYATTPDNRFDLYVFRETGFREQTTVLRPVEQIVERFAQEFTRVNALLIMALRIDSSGDPYIVELHGDLGGDLIADELFPAAGRNFNYFQLCIEIATSSGRNIMQRNFEPSALLDHNDYFKDGSSDSQFSIRKAKDLGALHESIQLLIKRSFFHDDEITNHLAFYRNRTWTGRNSRVKNPVRVNRQGGLR